MKAPHRPKAPKARLPYHVAIAVGVSTGLYAVSLVAATRLQIDTDRALIEDRAPVQGAINALGDHHAWLERQLDEARVRYTERVAGYDGLASRVQKLDDRLVKMDKTGPGDRTPQRVALAGSVASGRHVRRFPVSGWDDAISRRQQGRGLDDRQAAEGASGQAAAGRREHGSIRGPLRVGLEPSPHDGAGIASCPMSATPVGTTPIGRLYRPTSQGPVVLAADGVLGQAESDRTAAPPRSSRDCRTDRRPCRPRTRS